jgi:hypothetical protein
LKDVPPPTEEMLFRRSPMCYRGAVVMLQAFRVQLDWDELVSFARWLDLSSTVSEWCDSLVLLWFSIIPCPLSFVMFGLLVGLFMDSLAVKINKHMQ